MVTQHVTHLLSRYASGQLHTVQRTRVANHVRTCAACRSALAREELIAADLRREMPRVGQVHSGQLSGVWASVWGEVSPMRRRAGADLSTWLPAISVVLVMALVLLFVLPLLSGGSVHAGTAAFQARPVNTASPTPGTSGTDEARLAARDPSGAVLPESTVAFASVAGATPAPVPQATVSPEARYGGTFRR